MKQRTILREVSIKGKSLHTGEEVNLTLKPAPENTGVVFRRIALFGKPELKPLIDLVDDLVRSIVAALENPAAEGIYNVADGNHVSGTEYYLRVAQLANLPPPREISRANAEREFSSARLSFLAESRRLDTRRLRDDLGVELHYDDLNAGIVASLASSTND